MTPAVWAASASASANLTRWLDSVTFGEVVSLAVGFLPFGDARDSTSISAQNLNRRTSENETASEPKRLEMRAGLLLQVQVPILHGPPAGTCYENTKTPSTFSLKGSAGWRTCICSEPYTPRAMTRHDVGAKLIRQSSRRVGPRVGPRGPAQMLRDLAQTACVPAACARASKGLPPAKNVAQPGCITIRRRLQSGVGERGWSCRS